MGKLRLRKTLQEYEARCRRAGRPVLRCDECLPLTYELTNSKERRSFEEMADAHPNWWWIVKPTGMNCGQGIFVVDDAKVFREKLAKEDADREPGSRVPVRIVQRYITNPMLLDRRKFDIRSYMLIASAADPMIGYYGGNGYCRLTCNEYTGQDASNKAAHLTNQAVQRKDPKYKELNPDDTTWSFGRLNDYLNDNNMAPSNWALEVLPQKIKAIMTQLLLSIQDKLDTRAGIFDFLGLDFLIDTDLNVYLIEVNVNPALHRPSQTLEDRVTKAVSTSVDIVLDIFERRCRKEPALPLECDMGEFEQLVPLPTSP